jgi:hypothetical protein
MTSFLDAASSYPTLIYTALLGVVLFYWLLALVGVVDFEASGIDIDTDLQADAGADDVGELAAYLVAFGLNGVPFSVVVTLMVLVAWTISCLAGMWLLPMVPTTLLQVLAGSAVLLVSFALALPVTARAIRPMRGLFVTHRALSNAALVGRQCVVLTSSVTEDFGRAEISTRGAGLNIRVWADTPNELTKGSRAVIVEYDPAGERYLIVGDP